MGHGRMEKTKILLSDARVLFREGIHFVLSGEEDFEVSAESTSNEGAYARIEADPPNMALLDMTDSNLDGLAATRRIRRQFPSISVILVIDGENEEQLFSAMRSGASACITRDIDPDQLLHTLRMVAEGEQPINEALLRPGIAAKVLEEFEESALMTEQVSTMLAHLSPTQAEILKCLAAGDGIEQASTKLGTSPEAITRQLKLVVTKLVANDSAREVIETVQRSLPSTIYGTVAGGEPAKEYVTKEQFDKFRQSLIDRFESFIRELGLHGVSREG